MIKERLTHYNNLVGPNGERLANTFRFQGKPNSDHPQIYRLYDSLLNHHSRLLRSTNILLSSFLPPEKILELQLILVSHDVPELVEEDISRLASLTSGDDVVPAETDEDIATALLLPDDIPRYRDFEIAQRFLENRGGKLPDNPLSFIARVLDTIDGNCFAYATLEHYAAKVGGETPDPNLQLMADMSAKYITMTREKYHTRFQEIVSLYPINLMGMLVHLHTTEKRKLDKSIGMIQQNGYRAPHIE